MKKILIILISILTSLSVTSVCALEKNRVYDFTDHTKLLNELNKTYNTNFHIYDKNEFYKSEYSQLLAINFEEYIYQISNISPIDLYNQCLYIINISSDIDANISPNHFRSTTATETKYFNNNLNKMTLKYKYSGDKFDTGYKPVATVSKVGTINYFEMSSYTGSFKNSNKTYSVVAKGKIVTYAGLVSKSFTINFNL